MSASSSGDATGATRAKGPKGKGGNEGNAFSRAFQKIATFVKQVIAEVKKVVTPGREEWITFVVVVLVFVLAIMAYVGALDFVLGKLMFWAFAH